MYNWLYWNNLPSFFGVSYNSNSDSLTTLSGRIISNQISIKMKVVTKIWMYFCNALSKALPCKVKRGVMFWGGKFGFFFHLVQYTSVWSNFFHPYIAVYNFIRKNDNRWMLNTWGNFTVFYASWDWHNAVYQDEEKGSHCSVTREMHQVLKWKHVEQICVSVDLNQFTCRIFFWKQHNLGILNFERWHHQQFCRDFSNRLTVYYLLR